MYEKSFVTYVVGHFQIFISVSVRSLHIWSFVSLKYTLKLDRSSNNVVLILLIKQNQNKSVLAKK